RPSRSLRSEGAPRFPGRFHFALLVEHDLFRKPVSTFRDHALLVHLVRHGRRGRWNSCGSRRSGGRGRGSSGRGGAGGGGGGAAAGVAGAGDGAGTEPVMSLVSLVTPSDAAGACAACGGAPVGADESVAASLGRGRGSGGPACTLGAAGAAAAPPGTPATPGP